MTKAEYYRGLAEAAMRPEQGFSNPSTRKLAEADVWAKLAIAAAVEEQGLAVRDGE